MHLYRSFVHYAEGVYACPPQRQFRQCCGIDQILTRVFSKQ